MVILSMGHYVTIVILSDFESTGMAFWPRLLRNFDIFSLLQSTNLKSDQISHLEETKRIVFNISEGKKRLGPAYYPTC